MTQGDITPDISPITDPEKSATIAKAITRATAFWGLAPGDAAALAGTSFDTFEQMLEGRFREELSSEQAARASLLIGIYKALGAVYSDNLAGQWLTNPNTGPAYGGKRPLDVMVEGGVPAMQMVRNHLEAVGQGQ